MKTGTRPLVIGNWKMNPLSPTLSAKLATELKKRLSSCTDVDVVVAPPCIFLGDVARTRNSSKAYMLGAQNVHYAKLGSFTGETSIPMLGGYGVSHIILGHSERRALGETDTLINEKLIAVIKAGLTGVVCVGEKKRDQGGHYLSHIEDQVRKALAKISRGKLEQVVIAYEPIWAIGTGDNATSADVHEMKLFIEKILSDMYGRNYAQKVRIIYGGSVNGKNAQELFEGGTVDGFLVGGASLHADEFAMIVKATKS